MLYQLHELTRNLLAPVHQAQANAKFFANPGHWWSQMPVPMPAAVNELFHRIGKDYEKPEWGINEIEVEGERVPIVVHEEVSSRSASCCASSATAMKPTSCTPCSTSRSCWWWHRCPATMPRCCAIPCARCCATTACTSPTGLTRAWYRPAKASSAGRLHRLHPEFIRHLGVERLHVVSVCQPTVPVLAAVSLMASRGEPTPRTLVMMGGPIDARCSPTAVNNLATQNPLSWFENNVIHTVPASYPGAGRRVYPGFLQHAGFLSMNPSRHFSSHWDFYTDRSRATRRRRRAPSLLRRVQRGAGHAG